MRRASQLSKTPLSAAQLILGAPGGGDGIAPGFRHPHPGSVLVAHATRSGAGSDASSGLARRLECDATGGDRQSKLRTQLPPPSRWRGFGASGPGMTMWRESGAHIHSRRSLCLAALGFWRGLGRARLNAQAQANRIEDAKHGAELGMSVLAQRFVEALAPEAG